VIPERIIFVSRGITVQTSGMWYFVVWWMGANVFDKHSFSIFCPECQGSGFLLGGITGKI